MSKRICVSVDLDGVVFRGQHEDFLAFLRNELGHSFDDVLFEETDNYSAAMGVSVPESNSRFALFTKQGPRPEFAPSALTSLAELQNAADVFFNTARYGHAADIAREVLIGHGVVFREMFTGMSGRKHEPIREHGLAYHLDDSAHEVKAVVTNCLAVTVVQFPSISRRSALPVYHDRVIVADQEKGVDHAWRIALETICG